MCASYEHYHNRQSSRGCGPGTPIQSLHSCANYPRRVGGSDGHRTRVGISRQLWIALEIAVVTTALQVGYLSPLLLEGLAIPPS